MAEVVKIGGLRSGRTKALEAAVAQAVERGETVAVVRPAGASVVRWRCCGCGAACEVPLGAVVRCACGMEREGGR